MEDHQKSKEHLALQEKLRHLDSFSVERGRFQGYLIAACLYLWGASGEDVDGVVYSGRARGTCLTLKQ